MCREWLSKKTLARSIRRCREIVDGVNANVCLDRPERKAQRLGLSASEPAIHKDVRNCNLTLTSWEE